MSVYYSTLKKLRRARKDPKLFKVKDVKESSQSPLESLRLLLFIWPWFLYFLSLPWGLRRGELIGSRQPIPRCYSSPSTHFKSPYICRQPLALEKTSGPLDGHASSSTAPNSSVSNLSYIVTRMDCQASLFIHFVMWIGWTLLKSPRQASSSFFMPQNRKRKIT